MGQAACIIIINGGKAYAAVENLADAFVGVNINSLEAAITASCNVVPYTSLSMQIHGKYLSESYTQPIIDLHSRIINELPLIDKKDAQSLVDELASLLFAASEALINAI